MKPPIARLALLLCAGWLAGCASPAPVAPPGAEPGAARHAIHVTSNGWHTAIVLPREALAGTGLLTGLAQLPEGDFLEFGWGDRDYYPARRATPGTALRAALLPTPAVMHVAARQRPPEPRQGVEAVALALTPAGLDRLTEAIAESVRHAADAPADPVAPGLRPNSRFYAAHGRFHLFNTCNTWTARMLRAGGVPVSPAGIVTAADLMARLRSARPSGRRARTPPSGWRRRVRGGGRRCPCR